VFNLYVRYTEVPAVLPVPPKSKLSLFDDDDEDAVKDDDVERGVKGDASKNAAGGAGGGGASSYIFWVGVFWSARLADRTATGQFQWLQTAGVQKWGNICIELIPVIIVCLALIGVFAIPLVRGGGDA
jgi:hypothetical protein